MNRDNMGCIGIIVIVVLLLAITGVVWSAEQVDYGHVKLVTKYGKLTGEVLDPGLNWITPFIESTIDYVTQTRSYETSDNPNETKADYADYPAESLTADGQQVVIRYTVLFHVKSNTAIQVATEIGNLDAVVQNIVKANSRNLTRNLIKFYTAEQLFTGEEILNYQSDVSDALDEKFVEAGIVLDDFLVRNIGFDPDYIQTIETQQIAEESIKTAGFQAEAAVEKAAEQVTMAGAEADRQILLAEAEAERTILLANAEAENVRILADAEAYSITTRGKALEDNPTLVQWEFVRNLNNVQWSILPAGDNLELLLPTMGDLGQ